jgi:DNA helicase-2/ATP-dependent DNA helicase PcrA
MHYLDSLNEEQRKAVLLTDGPVLIVAGAGAGKTKTLTYRIFHLLQQGVSPQNILAITFTNKAAAEMRERVKVLLDQHKNFESPSRQNPLISTFHSLGVKIIKENAPLLKLSRHFTIFDSADSKKAVKDALTSIGVEPKEHLDKVRGIISAEKNRGNTFREFAERASYDFTSELTKKAWELYEKNLRQNQALDFDDLLLLSLRLLQTNKEVLERYQDRFKYIHIDEYQDTNGVQNEIVELLSRKYSNICAVGDADQNIYGWRGAEIKHMLRFEKTYPNTQTVFLERNYRSTQNILNAANNIIEKNKFRIPKKLFTENNQGEKISLFEARSETDEAHFIALKCKELIEKGSRPEEISVLYRANFQSRALEEAMLAYGVPYQLLGTKFFERKEIKDLLSYVRASLNEEAKADFLRIINTPVRGIGKTTIDKLVEDKEADLPSSTLIKIQNVRQMLVGFKERLLNENFTLGDNLKQIIKDSGLEKLYSTKEEEDLDRLENLGELVTLSKKYDIVQLENGKQEALDAFLSDCALASDQDSLSEEKTGVKLMTVHASKGLEFDTVFISGLEDGLFPHSGWGDFSKKSDEDKEEERRLFYVAVTRARKKLYLTYANMRTIFGNTEVHAASEFIFDIPEDLVERENYSGGVEKRKPLISIEF